MTIKHPGRNATPEQRLQYAWDVAHEVVGDTKVRQGRYKVWQLTEDEVTKALLKGTLFAKGGRHNNSLMGISIARRDLGLSFKFWNDADDPWKMGVTP